MPSPQPSPARRPALAAALAADRGQWTRARLHISWLPLLLRSLPDKQRLLPWRYQLRRRLLRWMPWRLQPHVRRRVLRCLDQRHRRLEHEFLPRLQPKLLTIEISLTHPARCTWIALCPRFVRTTK